MKKIVYTLLLSLLLTATTARADESRSYNFSRGMEAFEQGNYQEAAAYLLREVKENDNRSAWYFLAVIFDNNGQEGLALTAINKALKLAEGDKADQALCHNLRAGLYNQLGDSAQTLNDINQTLRLQPKDPDYLLNRASFYIDRKQYELAKLDLIKALDLADKSQDQYARAMSWQVVLAKEAKQYDEAISWANRYADIDSIARLDMLGDISMDMHDYAKAAQYYIEAYDRAGDNYDTDSIEVIADSAYQVIAQQLQAKMLQQPDTMRWMTLMGRVALSSAHHNDGVAPLMSVVERDPDNAQAWFYLSQTYEALGHVDKALGALERVNEMFSDDRFYYAHGFMNLNDSRLSVARTDAETYLSKAPADPDAYSLLGFVNEYEQRYDEALDNFTFAVTLTDTASVDHLQARYHRALVNKAMGNDDAARADFEAVVAMSCKDTRRARAAAHLGRRELAEDIIRERLDNCPVDGQRKHRLRHAACAYAIMGDNDKAFDYLEQAMRLGYLDRDLLLNDLDLEPLRQLPRFKQLVDNNKPQPLPTIQK